MLEAIWICAAFLLGFFARQVGLPPLIGYLVTGFLLFSSGYSSGPVIEEISSAGVTLLLFTIGLKIKLGSLARPRVWAPGVLHMALISVAIGAALLALPLGLSWTTALLIGFALSYSSTVFAVKVLEDKGEITAIYGQLAIGVLIIQDLVAVLFMALSTGKIPSPWFLAVIVGLVPLRWLLFRIMSRTGHLELLILFGLAAALGSYELFEMVGIKGDLGALVVGMMLANHQQTDELAKSLMGLKDFFLVGFFISIGLNGLPSLQSLGIAVFLVALIPLKSALFFYLFTRFRLRSRTALLSTLGLSNYSEFGLIIAVLAASNGWISETWILTIALAVALSFLAASPINTASHNLYERWHNFLLKFQKSNLLDDERMVDIGHATVLLFGMGRVGRGAYDTLAKEERVLGIDMNPEDVAKHIEEGRNVIQASATDSDFWERISFDKAQVHLVMLAMPHIEENLFATEHLKQMGYTGAIAAIVKYEDETDLLKEAGVHHVFNFYTEAGAGFAANAMDEFLTQKDTPTEEISETFPTKLSHPPKKNPFAQTAP